MMSWIRLILMMKLWLSIFLLGGFFLFSSPIFSIEKIALERHRAQTLSIPNALTVVHWAKDYLPTTGTLTEAKDGFVYLKVDDDYINQLFRILSNSEYTKPPYFRRSDSPGAHISVFYVDERKQTGKITEIGQEYSFKIARLSAVPTKTLKYIVLEVTSPELEELRKKYGLSPLLKDHKFHITIAQKKEKYLKKD